MILAPWATHPEKSKGRRFSEPEDPQRTYYQRDRDRIIHCTAFRRLEYKTQVFVNHEGDLFRNRLTHSLEVAQIARSLARILKLNQDLAETIALAHDLGHTPFGHAGQDALNAIVKEKTPEIGGFEHNLQSLRVVDELEERYALFNGLNLSFETRAGILKHCSKKNALLLGDVAQRFLKNEQPSLEAQLVNLSDEVAYNNHDIDDGLRSGLIHLEQLENITLWNTHYQNIRKTFPDLKGRRVIAETIRQIINTLIKDIAEHTERNIHQYRIETAEDVPFAPLIVSFSPEIKEQAQILKKFLMDNLYRHYQVMRMSLKAEHIVKSLYTTFLDNTKLLPTDYQKTDKTEQAIAIRDYIAGMTDRYAMKEYRNLFDI
ncbi:deoxyguanosinetriphosphate triphosphohydrolase [Basilea psittacipulmonis]|nr:deoxyguanosinetriphosphate triphosphohydrolase [Basilea psittacipulmonis]